MRRKTFNKDARIVFIFFLMVPLLMGCTREPEVPTAYRVVSQIHIRYQNNSIYQFWHFNSDEKMEAVLTYLRILDPYGTPEVDPETVTGCDFLITLVYSDGSNKIYQQRSDRFLRIGDGPWRRIDPDTALQLSQLLGVLTSDPSATPETAGDPVPQL